MFSDSSSVQPAPRKWDAEIDTARRDDTWLAFESDIHQSPALRARVARALDRHGLAGGEWRMKKCAMCGWEDAEERTHCRRCGGPVRAASPLSPERRKQVHLLSRICKFLGVAAIVGGVIPLLVLDFWPRLGSDPETVSPAVSLSLIRLLVGPAVGAVLLWLAGYLEWTSSGVPGYLDEKTRGVLD